MYRLQLADRTNEPRLVQWDAWGNRADTIEVTPLWHEAERLTLRHGLVATAYEGRLGLAEEEEEEEEHGAARTLLESGNRALIDRTLPRLASRDPATFWTTGQWMTERRAAPTWAVRRRPR